MAIALGGAFVITSFIQPIALPGPGFRGGGFAPALREKGGLFRHDHDGRQAPRFPDRGWSFSIVDGQDGLGSRHRDIKKIELVAQMRDHILRSAVRALAHGFPEPFRFPVLYEFPQENRVEFKALGLEDSKDELVPRRVLRRSFSSVERVRMIRSAPLCLTISRMVVSWIPSITTGAFPENFHVSGLSNFRRRPNVLLRSKGVPQFDDCTAGPEIYGESG